MEKHQKTIKQEYPEGMTFMSAQRVLLMYFSYLFGLIGFFPIHEDILCLPLMTASFRRLKNREMSSFQYFAL